MGFLRSAEDNRTEIFVVVTARGKLRIDSGLDGASYPKARVFVLEDRTVVVVTPDADNPRKLRWDTYVVDTSTYSAATRNLTVNTVSGAVLTVDGQNCGCGMGAVGNAGPIDGPYKLTPVRAPEWHYAI